MIRFDRNLGKERERTPFSRIPRGIHRENSPDQVRLELCGWLLDQVLTCRDRGCAEAGATTTRAGDAAEGPCIAVIDTTAIELRDETRPPLDHHHHPAHVVVLQHRQGTPDARVSRTRYLEGRPIAWFPSLMIGILSGIPFAADDARSALFTVSFRRVVARQEFPEMSVTVWYNWYS